MASDSATLTFLGAAEGVTGSKFLLTVGPRRILIDAGLFQGEKALRQRNWEDFPVPPDTITDILLTHAHLDHCGYLPALVKHGFQGPIWCTAPTMKLAEIVLRDSAYLQERDAVEAAEGGYSKHDPPRPLYDTADVEATLPLLTEVEFDRDLDLGDGISARYVRAGHILGSASVRVETPGSSLLFSGDLGRIDHPVLKPRDTPPGADFVLVESTYGDREHPEPLNLPHEQLADAIRRAVGRGGSVLIPAFAVDRTEVVLQTLGEMMEQGRIPRLPVYVNSPMALRALDVYREENDELLEDVDIASMFGLQDIREVRTSEESRNLTEGGHEQAIIISSSGMATGGRVLHHLERMLPDPRNVIVLTGYQAAGTRGRALVDGATRLKMHGRYVGVKAEIVLDDGFSVHADGSDLLDWLRVLRPAPRTVFCVHGEDEAAHALADRIERDLGLDAVVPSLDEVVSLAAFPYAVPSAAAGVAGAPAEPPAAAPAEPPTAAPAEPPTAAPAEPEAPAVGAPSGPAAAGAPAVTVALGGTGIAAAHVDADLTPHREADGTIVLSGTLTIRLRPEG